MKRQLSLISQPINICPYTENKGKDNSLLKQMPDDLIGFEGRVNYLVTDIDSLIESGLSVKLFNSSDRNELLDLITRTNPIHRDHYDSGNKMDISYRTKGHEDDNINQS